MTKFDRFTFFLAAAFGAVVVGRLFAGIMGYPYPIYIQVIVALIGITLMTRLQRNASKEPTSESNEVVTENEVSLWPTGINNSIDPEDIIWMMDWTQRDKDGVRTHPDKPEHEEMFEAGPALAMLLINDVIFLNTNHSHKDWPEEAQSTLKLCVNCNDCFAWGCADAEPIKFSELENLYRLWLKYPRNGSYLWCCIVRGQLPQKPIMDEMIKEGIDIEDYARKFNLKANYYDGVSHVVANLKYTRYSEWCSENGGTPLPFDKHWWDGWYKFTATNPDWYSYEWKRKEKAAIDEWRDANCYEVLT